MLVRLAALVAVDAPAASYLLNLAAATDAGVTEEQVEGVLIGIAPVVGTPRIVSAAGNIARALGFAIAAALEELEDELEAEELEEELDESSATEPGAASSAAHDGPAWRDRRRPADQSREGTTGGAALAMCAMARSTAVR